MQEIYINMDDSGKLSKKEDYCTYGGIVFTSHEEKQKFSNEYKHILNNIKCSHCAETKDSCSKMCPEIKSSGISDSERRRFINLFKKYKAFSLVIDNSQVYPYIMESKASKGRYIDFVQKITMKEIIITLINENVISPLKPIKIIVNIDQQSTKSNGYYNLRDSLYEELKHGITNFNYGILYKPILKSDLTINVSYLDSKKSLAIQAADIIAGTTRRIMYYDELRSVKTQRLQKYNWVLKFFP